MIDVIYHWSFEELSCKKAQREFEIGSDHTTVDWRNFMRDICAEYFIAHPRAIGGPGMTVQIDESVFARRKANRGRVFPQQWVFGGYDVESKLGFLVAVPQVMYRSSCYVHLGDFIFVTFIILFSGLQWK